MYSYGPPHMAGQKQDDQLEHTSISYVRIRDVVLKTCQRRWTIGRSGGEGRGYPWLWHDMMMMMMMIYNSVCHMWVFAGFSCHGNSKITSIPPFKNHIIIYPAHEAYVMRTRNSDLGRRSPGGDRALCKGNTYLSRHIRTKWSRNSSSLVNSAFAYMWHEPVAQW